jgi:hypothetical protein
MLGLTWILLKSRRDSLLSVSLIEEIVTAGALHSENYISIYKNNNSLTRNVTKVEDLYFNRNERDKPNNGPHSIFPALKPFFS